MRAYVTTPERRSANPVRPDPSASPRLATGSSTPGDRLRANFFLGADGTPDDGRTLFSGLVTQADRRHNASMRKISLVLFLALGALASAADSDTATARYTADGQLQRPVNYRDWVFLTSGIDMSYTSEKSPDHHMFDNVFVNREAYRHFVETGTWADGTMLLIEARAGATRESINKRGAFQTTEVMAVEVHVKDSKRFEGSWAFFGFGGSDTAKMIPHTEECYSCHAAHAAVDTTFVQFYPTLIDIAKSKATLSDSYLKESKSQ
jgi:hypothetical protein